MHNKMFIHKRNNPNSSAEQLKDMGELFLRFFLEKFQFLLKNIVVSYNKKTNKITRVNIGTYIQMFQV